jgi:hypothetical protein
MLLFCTQIAKKLENLQKIKFLRKTLNKEQHPVLEKNRIFVTMVRNNQHFFTEKFKFFVINLKFSRRCDTAITVLLHYS